MHSVRSLCCHGSSGLRSPVVRSVDLNIHLVRQMFYQLIHMPSHLLVCVCVQKPKSLIDNTPPDQSSWFFVLLQKVASEFLFVCLFIVVRNTFLLNVLLSTQEGYKP